MTLFTLSASLSMLLLLYKPPLVLALLIVAQTTLVSLSLYMLLSTSWLSFILMMIVVSAMMVIFVYISCLASNDYVVQQTYWPLYLVGPVCLLLLGYYLSLYNQKSHAQAYCTMLDTDLSPILTYKLYEPYASALTIFLIIYLLVALIVVAKISMNLKGALRAMKP